MNEDILKLFIENNEDGEYNNILLEAMLVDEIFSDETIY
jgi:hypothetical protein